MTPRNLRRLPALTAAVLTLVACTAGEPGSPASPGPADVVRTSGGVVRGAVDRDVRTFQGIPYAAPPVGALRWAAPRPARRWSGTRDATRPGAVCPQSASPVAELAGTGEDCLLLNVTTPRAGGRGRPVMVWLHGGGGTNGAGSVFDPRRLVADNDVVVVTVNYRLGIFGNLALPGLAGGGTFGLQDQQAALRWVRDNAAAFGGDPGTVTLFGESYGALSTTAQLVSPRARGLFHRAVLQSDLALHDYPAGAIAPGAPAVASVWVPQAEAEAVGTAAARGLGCADVTCLRRLRVEALLPSGQAFTRFAYGNAVLPESPVAALRAGRFADVPVMSGGTRDEHRLYTATFYDLAGQPVTAASYRLLLRSAFGPRAERVAAAYPVSAYAGSPGLAWSRVVTDRVWAAALAEENRLLAARTTVWAYEFADDRAPGVIPFPPGFPPGAHHSSEVFYQFDAAGSGPFGGSSATLDPGQRDLAATMNRYWATFARNGDPNARGLPRWDAHGGVLALAPGDIRPVDYAAGHRLALWRGLR